MNLLSGFHVTICVLVPSVIEKRFTIFFAQLVRQIDKSFPKYCYCESIEPNRAFLK